MKLCLFSFANSNYLANLLLKVVRFFFAHSSTKHENTQYKMHGSYIPSQMLCDFFFIR